MTATANTRARRRGRRRVRARAIVRGIARAERRSEGPLAVRPPAPSSRPVAFKLCYKHCECWLDSSVICMGGVANGSKFTSPMMADFSHLYTNISYTIITKRG